MSPTNIIEQLQRDEGYRQFPYRDSRNVLTIGYGFNLSSDGLTLAESAEILRLRALNRSIDVSSKLPWTDRLDPVRRAVLVNMAYNLGIAGLLKFHLMLTAAQAGDWQAAAEEMLKSEWHNQVGARAERLAKQMLTGEWQ
jgi:lysozyme